MDNQSDKSVVGRISESRLTNASVCRGLCAAVPAASVGFAVGYVMSVAMMYLDRMYPHYGVVNIRDAVRGFGWDGLPAAIGCSFLFSMAAVINYTPAQRLGMLRSLARVGAATLMGVAGALVICLVGQLVSEGVFPGRRTPFESWILYWALVAIVCIAWTIFITNRLIRHESGALTDLVGDGNGDVVSQ